MIPQQVSVKFRYLDPTWLCLVLPPLPMVLASDVSGDFWWNARQCSEKLWWLWKKFHSPSEDLFCFQQTIRVKGVGRETGIQPASELFPGWFWVPVRVSLLLVHPYSEPLALGEPQLEVLMGHLWNRTWAPFSCLLCAPSDWWECLLSSSAS